MNLRNALYSLISCWMPALFLAMVVISGAEVQAQVTDLSQQGELQQRRTVLEIEERIRILYSQGKYVEVLEETKLLTEADPNNQRAILWRDNAERRLAHGGIRPTNPLSNAPLPTPATSLLDREYVMEPPPPLEPRRRYAQENFITTNLNNILIGVGVLIGIGLIVLLVLWMKNKKAAAAPATRPAAAGGLGLGRSQTWMGDFQTQQDQQTRGQTESYDLPTQSSVFDQPTSPDIPTEYGHDGDTNYDPQTNVDEKTSHDPPTRSVPTMRPPAKPAPQEVLPPVQADPLSEFLSFDNLYHEEKAPEGGTGMGIDYSDTDSPLSQSQGEDVFQTGPDAFAPLPPSFAPEPPPAGRQPRMEEVPDIVPSAYTPPPIASNSDADDLLGTSDDDTFAVGPAMLDPKTEAFNLDSAFAPDQTASLDPNAQTFNSLMFGSEKTQAPKAENTPAPETPAEELTVNSFNREFSNVMFGSGAEDTKLPEPNGDKTQVEQAAETIKMEPASSSDDDDDEKTAVAAPSGGGPRISMFDRQCDAGKRALEAEDFARAVQCFSVAASLKPNDKEVRDLLEEARKKRRG